MFLFPTLPSLSNTSTEILNCVAGSITIALEYMDGGSLANVLNQVGPIPERVLASIAYQILWGLAYLKHEKRVHRDMKPSNLLINSQGEVKVGDSYFVDSVIGELLSTHSFRYDFN
jgi:serine/threonine protein kinase